MATQPLTLPNELWFRILAIHQEDSTLPSQWTSLRHVCISFRDAIKSLFRENVLAKTWIRFDLGNYTDNDNEETLLQPEFSFSHLSEDKSTAIFKMEAAEENIHSIIRKRLREYTQEMDIETPQHTIQVRRDLSDGPLPDLSIDDDKFELSCNWRELYTIFYGEITISENLLKGWSESQKGWAEGMRAQMETGGMSMMSVLQQAMGAFASKNNDAIKIARRARVKRQFKLLGKDWDPEVDGRPGLERDILKGLADVRQVCSMEEFEDDEFDDGEEADDADGSDEDDEWEDEDESSDHE